MGTQADVSVDDNLYKQGFLSFLRLIGTIYYKKHATGFETPSPATHFSKFVKPTTTALQWHTDWVEDIRQNIWDRVTYENEIIPSTDALWRYWKRSCWVLHMWSQANQNEMHVKPLQEYGWRLTEGNLAIEWDSTDNIQAIHKRVQQLTAVLDAQLLGVDVKRRGTCVQKVAVVRIAVTYQYPHLLMTRLQRWPCRR